MSVQPLRYELDSNARRSANGTALFGGSPFRLMRLSVSGSALLDQWLAGERVDESDAALSLRSRLVDAGLLHPVVEPALSGAAGRVGFVLPVFDDGQGAAAAIDSIRAEWPDASVIVVDDASTQTVSIEGATVISHDANRGPGAARNTGVAALPAEVDTIVFVDSDVVLESGCVGRLFAHFADQSVTAVAPRIRSAAGRGALAQYEADASPLDLGPDAAVVRPGSSVPYVPSTVLAVRRADFDAVGGFEESMRVGEDVDFIWRLVKEGATVRYEPSARARHRNRDSWSALAEQRHVYGTAAATLDLRHPGNVAPVEMPVPMLAAWGAAAFGGPTGAMVGGLISAVEAKKLDDRLGDSLPDSTRQTLALSLLGHRHAARWLAHAVRRAWLPLLLMVSPFSRRVRRVLLASLAGPILFDRRTNVAAGLLDDAAYCSGLWRGALGTRNPRVLLPRTERRR